MSDSGGGALKGALTIVACGLFLGFAYNAFGLISENPWGLSWVSESKLVSV